jgi:hypothetical protein
MAELLGVPRVNYPEILGNSQNFPDIQRSILDRFALFREEGITRIGFVSGPLRKESMREDARLMSGYAGVLEGGNNFPMVCSAGIFFDELWVRIPEPKLPSEEKKKKFLELFQGILKSGYITDIYMMPDWKHAAGAVDEHDTAEAQGIAVHYLGSLEDI